MKSAERAVDVLAKLREVGGHLAGERDPRRLVGLILDQAIVLTGAERGFVITLEGPRFDISAARNLDQEEIRDPEFKVSRSIVQRVAQSGKAELICDAAEEPATREIESVKALELRSILCCPLRVQGNTLGVVYVDHRHLKAKFDAEDLATLETFTVHAAVVLDAARRADELGRSRDELRSRVDTIERLRAELAHQYTERSREADRLRGEATRRAPAEGDLPGMIARSPSMKRVVQVLRRVAPTDAPVLIRGESGTGKEVLARALHALSPRRDGPFVAENCAALADPLLESELFGHEQGAFTGAHKQRAGLFESARGGTILLDEVGEMSPSLQAKLLRVLQEREVRRVGGESRLAVDVRVVAATHRDLEAMVAAGTFRADLLYRLNVVRLDLPPLRERLEDLPPLIDLFLTQAGDGVRLEAQTRELLLAYSWPGNVRELQNEIQRLAIFAGAGGTAGPGLLSPAVLGRKPQADDPLQGEGSTEAPIEGVWRLEELEREIIQRALRRARGNRTTAAKLLGLGKTSLYRRLEKHGLHAPEAQEGRGPS